MSARDLFPCVPCRGIELATLWKTEMQYYGKIVCNFLQKLLAKNNKNK